MSAEKRNALGRGLGALLNDSVSVNTSNNNKSQIASSPQVNDLGSVNEIKISEIEVNPFQPRTDFDEQALSDLADSIKLQGLIQPITVRRVNAHKYQLISGERRLRASKIAGLTHIPAYVRTANDQQMLEMALIENIQRESLNAIEVALSFQRMLDECNLKQEELGERVSKNRSTVTNYLRLLRFGKIQLANEIAQHRPWHSSAKHALAAHLGALHGLGHSDGCHHRQNQHHRQDLKIFGLHFRMVSSSGAPSPAGTGTSLYALEAFFPPISGKESVKWGKVL